MILVESDKTDLPVQVQVLPDTIEIQSGSLSRCEKNMTDIVFLSLEVGDLVAHYDPDIHPGDFIFDPDVGLVLLINDSSVKIAWTSIEEIEASRTIDTPKTIAESFLLDGTWSVISREPRG